MKFDYSNRYKFNKNNKEEKEKIVKEEVEEKEEVIEEPVEEVTEENLIELETEETVQEEINDEKVNEDTENVEEPKEELKVEKYGTLINCDLLNGRKEPNSNSEIILVLKKEDTIKILEELDEFYKVLVNNKEVYCMKKFIEIK